MQDIVNTGDRFGDGIKVADITLNQINILEKSGDIFSPTGRKIHEEVMKGAGLTAPVKIGILETPTGYEVNAIHGWPERMQNFFEKSLRNYKPIVSRIRAWRRDGEFSTNNPEIVDAILTQDYLYCGAGSPGYAIRHLKDSLAYNHVLTAHKNGKILCFGSATAVAVSRWAIPVYEIFKAGEDLRWLDGLDFFKPYGLHLAIVPHWNNQEGEDFDTSRCWMGLGRFELMRAMLPPDAIILGIDEQTACIMDISNKSARVSGAGNAYIVRGNTKKIFPPGSEFSFQELS